MTRRSGDNVTALTVPPVDVAGVVAAGDPTASGSLTILDPPTDPPTIDTIPAHANEVVRGLITLNTFTQGLSQLEEWFRLGNGLGTMSIDSDMDITASVILDRLRWQDSDGRLNLNRVGSGSMAGYFGAGNPGNSQFIYIATAAGSDHILELDINAGFFSAGSGFLRLEFTDAASRAFLNTVQPGGVINLVIADEGAPVLVTDVAGTGHRWWIPACPVT